ncbi:MAG TPA: cytochrome c1 [Gammaproteobacteria bacterium]|nr:cytochrome c1 [Gammaproteobacteria bacterium]
MRKTILILLIALVPAWAMAAGPSIPLDKANINLHNKESLQRGAKLFVNYCLSCHSAQYQRYNRMARDLGLTDEQVAENLVFTGAQVGEQMKIAMSREDATRWFGAPPPDLTLVARSRGVDWLYTYLRTFYIDESRPFGVNNEVFPSVGMPHVLWELEGMKKATTETTVDKDGNPHTVITGYEMVKPGSLSPAEYDRSVRDLVAFMAYIGEPAQLERKRLGVWVLLFLAVLLVVSYLMKKEYWKDIH